jgi:hypothetical protein
MGPMIRKMPARTPIAPKMPGSSALPMKARVGQHKPNNPPIKAKIAINVTPNGLFMRISFFVV